MLSDRRIKDRFNEIFDPDTANKRNIRAAKYYLTLGNEFLIPPGKRRFGENDPCRKGFVLEPGQTALVSTMEHISIPVDLSAIFGPVFDVSDSGILFFGGMLVDPGFGGFVKDKVWHRKPEPLSFYLANVGSKPYPLYPGTDRIASIAFMTVEGPRKRTAFPRKLQTTTAQEVRDELFADDSEFSPDGALGLVEDIREMRQRVEKIDVSTKQVVFFGVVVLAVSLFAAMVSLLASTGAENIVLSLNIGEVLVGLLAIGVVPLTLVASFYLWVTALAKLQRRSKRRKKVHRIWNRLTKPL